MKSTKYSLLNKNTGRNQIFDKDVQLQDRSAARFNDIPYSKFQEQLQNNQKEIKRPAPSGKIIKNTKIKNNQQKLVNQSSLYINQQIDHNPFGQNTSSFSPFGNANTRNHQNMPYPTFQDHNPYKQINQNKNTSSQINNTSSQINNSKSANNLEGKGAYQHMTSNYPQHSQIPFNYSNVQQYYQYPQGYPYYSNYHNTQPYQPINAPNTQPYQPINVPNTQPYQPINPPSKSQVPNIQPISQVNQQSFIKNKEQNVLKISNVSKKSQQYIRLNSSKSSVSRLNSSIIKSGLNGAEIDIQNPYVPPVIGQCQGCGQKQHIPGDQGQFYCYKCNKLNLVEPKFGLFICGSCRGKVSYPYTLSDHIQCNICYTVNKVPLHVQSTEKLNKSKIMKLSDDSDETESILPKELKELAQQNVSQTSKWGDNTNIKYKNDLTQEQL